MSIWQVYSAADRQQHVRPAAYACPYRVADTRPNGHADESTNQCANATTNADTDRCAHSHAHKRAHGDSDSYTDKCPHARPDAFAHASTATVEYVRPGCHILPWH